MLDYEHAMNSGKEMVLPQKPSSGEKLSSTVLELRLN